MKTEPIHAATLAEDYAKAGFAGAVEAGSRPALIIIDPAKAYIEPSSPLYAGVEESVEQMKVLRALCAKAGIPIIVTRVLYDDDSGFWGGQFYRKVPALKCFVAGNPLAEFIDGLAPVAGEHLLTKHYPSAFYGTPLAAALNAHGVDTLLIAGLSTSGCVRATALDALQNGFVPIVVREAVGDRHQDPHECNLRDISAKCGEVWGLGQVDGYLNRLLSHHMV